LCNCDKIQLDALVESSRGYIPGTRDIKNFVTLCKYGKEKQGSTKEVHGVKQLRMVSMIYSGVYLHLNDTDGTFITLN